MSEFASGPRNELQEKLPALSLKKKRKAKQQQKLAVIWNLITIFFIFFLAKCFALL